MKKIVGVLFILLPLYARGQNMVFNPGFDMVPWDTGWTTEIDTHTYYRTNCNLTFTAKAKKDTGRSLPNSCSLYTKVFAYPSGGFANFCAYSKVTISQIFDEIPGCEIKGWIKFILGPDITHGCFDTSRINIDVLVNNGWMTISEISFSNRDTSCNNWTEVSVSVDTTIRGIRFCSFVLHGKNSVLDPSGASTHFWIDDIYIGKTGIEESKELKVKSIKLEIYPNPFIRSTIVRLEDLKIEDCKIMIYDMVGKLVEQTEGTVIGEDLPSGIYFVRAEGYKPIKVVKLGGVR
jgi:hypothetical protein